MSLKTMKKDELELLSNKDIAFMILTEGKRKLNTADLFRKIMKLLDLPESTFEAKIAAQGTEKFSLFALKMEQGNSVISFRDRKLWINRPKTNDWIQPGKIKYNVWQKYKIRFDAANRTAEYYIDDMDIPVFVDAIR